MRTRQDVIETMIFEIDEICAREGIQYFLTSKAMYCAMRNEHLGVNMITADLVMTAENLDRFVKAFEADPMPDREIEYLGNSEKFPGLFLRYVDTTTIHYNTIRLSCERCMGMYVTINVIRPELSRVRQKLFSTWEMVRKNKMYYNIAYNRRLGKMLYKRQNQQIKKLGEEETARRFYEMLIKEYSGKDTKKRCWVMKPNSLNIEKFGNGQFREAVEIPYLDKQVSVPVYYHEKMLNVAKPGREVAPYVNNKISFCDTEISYKEFDLDKYRADAIKYRKNIRKLNMEMRPYKRKRIELFKVLLTSYYRYLYGTQLLPRMEEIEELFKQGKYQELDLLIGPYVRTLRKNKNIYLSERLNEIIYEVYSFKPDQLYSDVPAVFKEGLPIYDSKGEYVKTLGDHNG